MNSSPVAFPPLPDHPLTPHLFRHWHQSTLIIMEESGNWIALEKEMDQTEWDWNCVKMPKTEATSCFTCYREARWKRVTGGKQKKNAETCGWMGREGYLMCYSLAKKVSQPDILCQQKLHLISKNILLSTGLRRYHFTFVYMKSTSFKPNLTPVYSILF